MCLLSYIPPFFLETRTTLAGFSRLLSLHSRCFSAKPKPNLYFFPPLGAGANRLEEERRWGILGGGKHNTKRATRLGNNCLLNWVDRCFLGQTGGRGWGGRGGGNTTPLGGKSFCSLLFWGGRGGRVAQSRRLAYIFLLLFQLGPRTRGPVSRLFGGRDRVGESTVHRFKEAERPTGRRGR